MGYTTPSKIERNKTMMNKGTPRYKNKRLATVKERIKALSLKLKRWQDEHDEIVKLQQPKTQHKPTN